MLPTRIALALLEDGFYKYGCAMVHLPQDLGDFLLNWGKLNIPDESLHVDEDNGKGREDEMHVTVKFGLLADRLPDSVKEIAKNTEPFRVFLGNISFFRNGEYDVVKIDVESPALRELNRQVSDAVPNEDKHPNYNPHVTLAYVKPGSCDKLEGVDPFQDGEAREFIAQEMVYKGEGDSNDPDREVVTLQFDRSKDAEAELAVEENIFRRILDRPLNEEVLGPSVSDLDAIRDIITRTAEESNGDASVFKALANDALQDYHVQFGVHPDMAGAPAMATPQGVFIRPPAGYDLRSSSYLNHLMAMVQHELVHVQQMARMENPVDVYSKALDYVAPNGVFNSERYTKQKQEVMAWASSMVEAWRNQNLTPSQMRHRLKYGNWGMASKYWSVRKTDPDTFNRFVKQASAYIDKLENGGFSESSRGTDPFTSVKFPADASMVKRFLRSNSSNRQGGLPIL